MLESLVHQCDITKLQIAAIVTFANQPLLKGDGKDSAKHRVPGPPLEEA